MKIAFECWINKHGYENKDLNVMWDIFSAIDEEDKFVLDKGQWSYIARRFTSVLEKVKEVGTNDAINACYRHPWRFYRTHSAEQAIEIILNDKGRKNNE